MVLLMGARWKRNIKTMTNDTSDRIKTLECALEDALREIVNCDKEIRELKTEVKSLKLTLAKMKSLLEYPASLER